MIKPAERVSVIQEYYFSRKLKEVAQLNKAGQEALCGSTSARCTRLSAYKRTV